MRTRQCSMRSFRLVVALNLSVFCASVICAQSTVSANLPVAPPNLLLLMHQEVPAGRASEADRLLVSLSRACDRLETPSYWINLQSYYETKVAKAELAGKIDAILPLTAA